MPHIVVKLYPGVSEEQKSKIAQEITKVVQQHAEKPEEYISVDIKDVPQEQWMEQVYETEIKPNLDKLYKKPGY